MNEIWSDEVEDITFITLGWKSLSILPSLFDLLINDPMFSIIASISRTPSNPTPLHCHCVVPFQFALKKITVY